MSVAKIPGVLVVSVAVLIVGSGVLAAEEKLIVRGQVVNQAQEPVEGAMLVLVLRHGHGKDAWQVDGKSGSDGQFELSVPREWTKPGPFYHSRTIWCYAPGFALQTASAFKQLDQGSDEPVKVPMENETVMEFRVLDPKGSPIEACRVEPHHWLAGSYDIPPEIIRDLTASKTDKQGVAKLSAMQPAKLYRVATLSDEFGTQRMQLDSAQRGPTTIHLRNVGTLAGRLTCDDPKAIANVRVAVDGMTSWDERGLTEGAGQTETAADGSFRIEKVAEGPFYLYVRGDQSPIFRPRLPEQVAVKAGETTRIEIPLERTVTVVGSVVARGSTKPVENAFVSVSYGGRRQSEHVMTGADGRFVAYVLPGEVRQQLIVVPKPFQDWVRDYDINSQYEVTLEDSPFDLPPLELVESRAVEGKVVDANGQPVPEAYVTPVSNGRGLGSGRADKSGSFSVRISKEAKIEEYRVSLPAESHGKVKVTSEDPLILQLMNPEEAANVKVTTQPTPEDKREPKLTLPDANIRTLIVAREALIYEGRATNWAELAEELRKLGNNGIDPPVVHYHLTHDAFRDQARQEEAQNWAEMLSKTTPAKVQRGGGIILNRAAERYDALEIGDEWPPGAEKPVVGRVVSSTGEPIENAQVVFFPPPPPTARLRGFQSVYLKNGVVREPNDHIVTYSKPNGEFRFDFPAAGSNVIAVAPQGFAIVAASDQMADIKLAPWARVTAKIPRDERGRLQTMSLSISAKPDGGGATTHISISAGDLQTPDTSFEMVAVPAGHRMMVQRILWKEDANGSQTGNGHGESLPLTLEPGTTTHLEYGPLGETK